MLPRSEFLSLFFCRFCTSDVLGLRHRYNQNTAIQLSRLANSWEWACATNFAKLYNLDCVVIDILGHLEGMCFKSEKLSFLIVAYRDTPSFLEYIHNIQGVPKNVLIECSWSHGAQAQSPVIGTTWAWKVFFARFFNTKTDLPSHVHGKIQPHSTQFCSIGHFFGTPCTSLLKLYCHAMPFVAFSRKILFCISPPTEAREVFQSFPHIINTSSIEP